MKKIQKQLRKRNCNQIYCSEKLFSIKMKYKKLHNNYQRFQMHFSEKSNK